MAVRAASGTKPESTSGAATKAKSVPASKPPKSEAAAEERAAKAQAPTSVQPVEPEDAYLTGVSRSLQRRLLGLNVDGARGQSKPVPGATSPGLHSTGSYTGAEGEKPDAGDPSPKSRKKK